MKKLQGREKGQRQRQRCSVCFSRPRGRKEARGRTRGVIGIYMCMRRCSMLGAWWATAMPPGGNEWISRA